jgi:hypothetical protein
MQSSLGGGAKQWLKRADIVFEAAQPTWGLNEQITENQAEQAQAGVRHQDYELVCAKSESAAGLPLGRQGERLQQVT